MQKRRLAAGTRGAICTFPKRNGQRCAASVLGIDGISRMTARWLLSVCDALSGTCTAMFRETNTDDRRLVENR